MIDMNIFYGLFDFPTGSLTLDYLGLRQHGREVKISATKALRRKQKLPKLPKNTKHKTQNTKKIQDTKYKISLPA